MTARPNESGLKRSLLGVVVVASGAMFWSAPTLAQTSPGSEEAEYQAGLAEYDELLQQRERTFSLYEQALDRVDSTRGVGDQAARADAHADFQVVAFDLMDLELALEQSGARLAGVRAAYLASLEAREAELMVRLSSDQTMSPEAEAVVLEEWRQVRTRVLQIQADAIPEETIALRPVPELTVDPRDGPVESLEKASFMEEKALSYASLIVDLDAEVAELERQSQQLQSVQDLLRDVGRFGSDFVQGDPPGLAAVPDGGPDSNAGDTRGPPDPDGLLAQLPLGEQIDLLRGARDLAVQYREQALVMARVFRDRAEGMRP